MTVPLNSRDIEKTQTQPFEEPWYLKVLGWLFKLIYSIPWVREKSKYSMGSLSGSIFRCQHRGDHKKATQIAIFAMDRFRNHKDKWVPEMEHHHWWRFVQHACESASQIEDNKLRNKIISEVANGIEPFEGYSVAYSFLQISKWKYAEGDHEEAIEHAQKAIKADETWAEAEFILGWLGLATGKVDPMDHLAKAVEKDNRILFRISSDDLCKKFPHITKKLKTMYSVTSE